MNISNYTHEQLAAGRQRDLLEPAERARLAAQARWPPTARKPFRLAFRWPRPHRRAALESSLCAPPTETR